jgi:hypothetical protein
MESPFACKYHNKDLDLPPRKDFAMSFYEVLLWVPMEFSMRLYKEVKVGCDCSENYKVFDAIVKEALEHTLAFNDAPKDEEQSTE